MLFRSGLNFTVVSKLLLLSSTTDITSTLKMKSFSTVRVTQRGSQRYMEKRRGRPEIFILSETTSKGKYMISLIRGIFKKEKKNNLFIKQK